MRALTAMIQANLKMSVRNRTALFWNLAFPAIFILIFGAVFGRGSGLSIDVAIVGSGGQLQTGVAERLRTLDQTFIVVTDSTAEKELALMRDGDRDVVVLFDGSTAAAPVTIYYDETKGQNAQIAVNVLQQVIGEVAAGGAAPVVVSEPVSGQAISFMDIFLPGIIAMSLMNSGVIGLSTAFVTYRERGILRRIKVTPFPLWQFILARIISQVLVAFAQAAILILMSAALFDLHLRGNWLVVGLAILVGALAFLALGFAISSFARNTEIAASYANLVTFPMLFLSGIFFSMDSAPGWLQPITRVLPLRYLVDALREPMTRGRGLSDIGGDLLILAATFAVAMVVAVRFFKWDSRTA